MEQRFGGQWTEEKLNILEKYLRAYLLVMKKNSFITVYIDAYAGTGKIGKKYTPREGMDGRLFPEDMLSDDPDVVDYIEGSATKALNLRPGFDEYHFIEMNRTKYNELSELIDKFPEKHIWCHNDDANAFLQNMCKFKNRTYWQKHRAVVFLDPFGMNLEFSTLEAIAATHSIDVWILFPLGSGVSRLLQRRGNIPIEWQNRLTAIFGSEEWRERFYKATPKNLFSALEDSSVQRDADFGKITDYFIERLHSIFLYVMEKPVMLYNTKSVPLYAFCFAAGNAGNGGKIAVNIAKSLKG